LAVQPVIGGGNRLRELVQNFGHINLVAGITIFTMVGWATKADCVDRLFSFSQCHKQPPNVNRRRQEKLTYCCVYELNPYYKALWKRNQVKVENLSTKLEKNTFLRYSLSIAR